MAKTEESLNTDREGWLFCLLFCLICHQLITIFIDAWRVRKCFAIDCQRILHAFHEVFVEQFFLDSALVELKATVAGHRLAHTLRIDLPVLLILALAPVIVEHPHGWGKVRHDGQRDVVDAEA